MNNIFLWIVTVDAGLVLLAGLAAAVMFLLNRDMTPWRYRIGPATLTIVLTTLAAGAILAAGRWMFGG